MKVNNELIRALRTKHTMSQEALTEAANLSPRTVQRIESSGLASLESTMAIAAVFEIEPDALEDTRLEEARIAQNVRRGLYFGMAGLLIGALLAVVGVVLDFIAGGASAKQAGLMLSAIGAFTGLFSALIGTLAHRQRKSLIELDRALEPEGSGSKQAIDKTSTMSIRDKG